MITLRIFCVYLHTFMSMYIKELETSLKNSEETCTDDRKPS